MPAKQLEDILNNLFDDLERKGIVPNNVNRNKIIETVLNSLKELSPEKQSQQLSDIKLLQKTLVIAISLHSNPVLQNDNLKLQGLVNHAVDLIFKKPTKEKEAEIKLSLYVFLMKMNNLDPNNRLTNTQLNQLKETLYERMFSSPKPKPKPKPGGKKESKEEEQEDQILVSIFGVNTKAAGLAVPIVQVAALNLVGFVDVSPLVSKAEISSDKSLDGPYGYITLERLEDSGIDIRPLVNSETVTTRFSTPRLDPPGTKK